MNNIKVEDIVIYLPYKLKYIDSENGCDGIRILNFKNVEFMIENGKPLLRKISSLTDDEIKLFSMEFKVWQVLNVFDLEDMPYNDIKILSRLHIDFLGLIKKGLAIDINTLNIKP